MSGQGAVRDGDDLDAAGQGGLDEFVDGVVEDAELFGIFHEIEAVLGQAGRGFVGVLDHEQVRVGLVDRLPRGGQSGDGPAVGQAHGHGVQGGGGPVADVFGERVPPGPFEVGHGGVRVAGAYDGGDPPAGGQVEVFRGRAVAGDEDHG